jgi:aspartate/methionine/tyrosine aminotransferase
VGSDEPIARVVEQLLEQHHPSDRVGLSGSPKARMPLHVREAIVVAAELRGYAPSAGENRFRLAIQTQLRQEGIACDLSNILVTNGAMHALDLCFRSLLSAGDEVLMHRPGFFIGGLVARAGGELRTFDSPASQGFRPDWDQARASLSPRTKVLYVNSPVNPTGYVFTEEDINEALALAEQADLWIVSDESLSRFTYAGRRHLSPTQRSRGISRTFLVRSFSKDYAMPGWRMGYVVSPAAWTRRLTAMLEWTVLSVSRVPQAAALAALTGPRQWTDSMPDEYGRRGDRLSDALNELPGLSCIPPQGGLNVFPSFERDADLLARQLVVRSGVPACPGIAFGVPGHFRLQFGGEEDAVDIAIKRIADTLRDL